MCIRDRFYDRVLNFLRRELNATRLSTETKIERRLVVRKREQKRTVSSDNDTDLVRNHRKRKSKVIC